MKVRDTDSLKGYTRIDLTAVTKDRYVREIDIEGTVDLIVRTSPDVSLTLYSKRPESASKVVAKLDGDTLQVSTDHVTNTRSRGGQVVQTIIGRKVISVAGDYHEYRSDEESPSQASKVVVGRNIRSAGRHFFRNGERVSDAASSVDDGDHWVIALSAPGPIESLKMTGAGDARLVGIAAQTLKISSTGAGNIEASGHVGSLDVTITGSGDIDTLEMPAARAKLTVIGTGDIDAHVSESVDATVMGMGDIRVHGAPPKRSKTVLGLGSIKFR